MSEQNPTPQVEQTNNEQPQKSGGTLAVVFKIIGVLQILGGLLVTGGALLIMFAGGTMMYTENLANSVGEDVGEVPAGLLFGGAALMLLLGIFNFVSAYALLASKKWAYIVLIIMSVIAIISGGYGITTGSIGGGAEIFWGVVYAVLAYVASQQKELFKN